MEEVTEFQENHGQQQPQEDGWFRRFGQSISRGASGAWGWTKAQAKSFYTNVTETKAALLFIAVSACSAGYAGGIVFIRNEVLVNVVPGLTLLAFSGGAAIGSVLVAGRFKHKRGNIGMARLHQGFNAALGLMGLSGLLYENGYRIGYFLDDIANPIDVSNATYSLNSTMLSNATAGASAYFAGTLPWYAQVIIPVGAVVTSLVIGATGAVIMLNKSKFSCCAQRCLCCSSPRAQKAKKVMKDVALGAIEYSAAPGGILAMLSTAQDANAQPAVPGNVMVAIIATFASVGVINELIIARLNKDAAKNIRLVAKDSVTGISSTAFLTNQALMVESVITNDNIPDLVFHPTWILCGLTLFPNIPVAIKAGLDQIKRREQQERGEEVKPDELVTWKFFCTPICCAPPKGEERPLVEVFEDDSDDTNDIEKQKSPNSPN